MANTPATILQALAAAPRQRLAIKVTSQAEKHIRQGHPWVFESSVVKQSAAGQAGDMAIIYDQKKNKLLAVGLYDPTSPIRIKLVAHQQPARLDADWFSEKIALAFAKRAPLLATDTNSYRLLHGENDGFPGFIADVYAEVLVIKLYTPIWLPYLEVMLPILAQQAGTSTTVLRLSRLLQQQDSALNGLHDGMVLAGTLGEEEVIFREHGIRFSANVIHGHKTGYFLDHRHNRHQIGQLAKGKTVLDVFAYAGGFSVHALMGGARAVTSLDISAQALAVAQRNVALNLAEAQHQIIAADAFTALEEMALRGDRFDIVVVDPPAFAKRQNEVERALQQYARLARLGAKLVAPGGYLLLASCSSRVPADDFYTASLSALRQTGRDFREWKRTQHDVDHPIGFPEGAYLKSIYLQF